MRHIPREDIIVQIFKGANFRGMLESPQKIFAVVIFAFQCQETTPTTSFAWVRGSFSQFLIFALTALPSKNAKMSRYNFLPSVV